MSYQTREATLDDLPTLKAFEQGIIAYERPYDSTLRPDPISYYDIGELIESDTAVVTVAEFEGAIVASGYAKKKASSSYAMPTWHAFLGMMFVHTQHRGRGVNALVLDALLAWSREHNLLEVHLTVYPGNESALKAYEKAGFQPHILEMRMGLDE